MNFATAAVLIALLVLVLLAVRYIKKRRLLCSCGGDCSRCAGACRDCRKREAKKGV